LSACLLSILHSGLIVVLDAMEGFDENDLK
jgi:hypothetical protein